MGERRDIMVRAALNAEGARHSKSVLFWLGGGWKLAAGLLAVAAVVLAAVKGAPVVTAYFGAHAGGILLGILGLAAVVLVFVVAAGLRGGGGRGRRL